MHELWNIGIYLFKIVWKKCQIECRVFAKKKEKKKRIVNTIRKGIKFVKIYVGY